MGIFQLEMVHPLLQSQKGKNLVANSDKNEGGLIHNIELDEPDRAMDNHWDDSV